MKKIMQISLSPNTSKDQLKIELKSKNLQEDIQNHYNFLEPKDKIKFLFGQLLPKLSINDYYESYRTSQQYSQYFICFMEELEKIKFEQHEKDFLETILVRDGIDYVYSTKKIKNLFKKEISPFISNILEFLDSSNFHNRYPYGRSALFPVNSNYLLILIKQHFKKDYQDLLESAKKNEKFKDILKDNSLIQGISKNVKKGISLVDLSIIAFDITSLTSTLKSKSKNSLGECVLLSGQALAIQFPDVFFNTYVSLDERAGKALFEISSEWKKDDFIKSFLNTIMQKMETDILFYKSNEFQLMMDSFQKYKESIYILKSIQLDDSQSQIRKPKKI